jgi:Spy/CpxP family protein refolding chaperone
MSASVWNFEGIILALRSILLFIFLVMLPALVYSQGGPGYRGGRPMMGPMYYSLEELSKELNLTPEQLAGLQQLRQSFFQDTLGWRNELVIKRFDLQDLLRQPQADTNQVLSKQREVSELESRIQERMVIFQLEMRKVLTPEQIKLLPPDMGYSGFGRHRGMMRAPGPGMKND